MFKQIAEVVSGVMSGGGSSLFLIPNVKSLLRKHVKDKDRNDKVAKIVDQFDAVAKAFFAKKKERLKEFRLLHRTYNSTCQELELLLFDDMEAHLKLQDSYIKARIAVANLITPEEWAAVGKDARQRGGKVYLDRQKQIADLNKTRLALEAKAEKAIGELARLREVKSILKVFWRNMAEISQSKNLNVASHPVLSNREATEAQLRELAAEINRVRQAAYRDFITVHQKLRDNITEKEWKKIA